MALALFKFIALLNVYVPAFIKILLAPFSNALSIVAKGFATVPSLSSFPFGAIYKAFQNKDYSNKWFFAFIDEVIYKSNKNTEIRFTVDVWSTWFNNWTASPCFIEREHVNDDTIGANTINENLSIEEVVQEGEDENISLNGENQDFYYIIMTTYNPSYGKDGDFVGVNRVNKNLFGAKLYAFNGSSVGATWVRNFLKHTNNKSKIESVQALFIAPRCIN